MTSADYSRVETQSPQFRYYGYGYMYLCTVWCCSRSRQFALSRYERANSSCELIRLVSYMSILLTAYDSQAVNLMSVTPCACHTTTGAV
jgi:hypothetical protein